MVKETRKKTISLRLWFKGNVSFPSMEECTFSKKKKNNSLKRWRMVVHCPPKKQVSATKAKTMLVNINGRNFNNRHDHKGPKGAKSNVTSG